MLLFNFRSSDIRCDSKNYLSDLEQNTGRECQILEEGQGGQTLGLQLPSVLLGSYAVGPVILGTPST